MPPVLCPVLRKKLAAANTHEVELLSNPSASSGQLARATAEMHQARKTISAWSKELSKVAQLKSSVKHLKDNVALHEASEEELKKKLAFAINDSTWLTQLVEDIRAEVV